MHRSSACDHNRRDNCSVTVTRSLASLLGCSSPPAPLPQHSRSVCLLQSVFCSIVSLHQSTAAAAAATEAVLNRILTPHVASLCVHFVAVAASPLCVCLSVCLSVCFCVSLSQLNVTIGFSIVTSDTAEVKTTTTSKMKSERVCVHLNTGC